MCVGVIPDRLSLVRYAVELRDVPGLGVTGIRVASSTPPISSSRLKKGVIMLAGSVQNQSVLAYGNGVDTAMVAYPRLVRLTDVRTGSTCGVLS